MTSLRQIIRSFIHETNSTPDWFAHPKHIFVFTWTGKPLFVRYGNDNKLVEIIGTMLAFISNFQSMNNPLLSFQAGPYQFVISNKEPLYLFAIHRTTETVHQIKLQLNLLYTQLISITTNGIIDQLNNNHGFDGREWLGGTDLLTHSFLNAYDMTLNPMFQVLETLKIHRNTRAKVLTALKKNRIKDHTLFTMLCVGDKVIGMVKPKTTNLHVYDIQLLLNMTVNQPSLRQNEAWTPICLPYTSPTDLMYVYTQYLNVTINDKLHDIATQGFNELQFIYPPHHQQIQGVATRHTFSPKTASITFHSNICLISVCSHPMFFSKCQQAAAQIVSYLESHTGELKQSEYISALLADNLTGRDDPALYQQDAFYTYEPSSSSQLSQQLSPANPSPQDQLQQQRLSLGPSQSFTHTMLQHQTVQTNPYLLDSIRQKYRDALSLYLQLIGKTNVTLLHELHFATLSTSNAIVSPLDFNYDPSVTNYDPKSNYTFLSNIQTHSGVNGNICQDNDDMESSNNNNNNTDDQGQEPCDLTHFVYIDIPTASIINSKTLSPYKNYTTGISIQTFPDNTENAQSYGESHISITPQSRPIDSNSHPFQMGGFGALCLTTTNHAGLEPNHSIEFDEEQFKKHREDFTKLAIAPTTVHINTQASQSPLIDRYKILYNMTHKCVANLDLTSPTIPGECFNTVLLYRPKQLNTPEGILIQQQQTPKSYSPALDNIVLTCVEYHDAILAYQSKPGVYEFYCTFVPFTPKESIHMYMSRVVQAIQKDPDSYFQRPHIV